MNKDDVQYIVAIVARQFYINIDKNVFTAVKGMSFSYEIRQSLNIDRQAWLNFPEKYWNKLSKYLVNRFLKSFYKTNQYLNFKEADCAEISRLYSDLFSDICKKEYSVEKIEMQHLSRLRKLIARLQPILTANSLDGIMNKYVCAEYSADFQLELLKITSCEIKEPILDIGCGEHGNLILELRNQGIIAYGLDRLCQTENGLINCSWFDFDFGEKKWGTILSNLSFSSHFLNNILNNTNDIIKFVEVYNKILNSLIIGGEWHYAPSLPQMESNLSNEFILTYTKIDDVFFKTKIVRKSKELSVS